MGTLSRKSAPVQGARLPLSIIAPPTTQRLRKAPTFARLQALALARRVMGAKSLRGAARIIRQEAESLPERSAWRTQLLKLARGLSTTGCIPPFSVFAMSGNTKLPFVAFSSLPVVCCPGAGECAQWCYSLRAWRTPEPYCRMVQNSLLLKSAPEFIRAAFEKLPQSITFRLYVDGDFSSAADVEFWMGALRARPDIQAYGYSKSWEELWAYGQAHEWPTNYVLNLSSGGRAQRITKEDMLSLPIVRGEFVALPIDYRPSGMRGNIGFKRYADPAYHRAVRDAAAKMGLGKVFSCPGNCGECTGAGHLCGQRGISLPIVIGVH